MLPADDNIRLAANGVIKSNIETYSPPFFIDASALGNADACPLREFPFPKHQGKSK
jgi:hypothetical protein